MTRLVKRHPALFSIAAIVFLVPFALRVARMNAISAVAAVPVAEASVASTMIRSGLGADALCAVGVTANQVTGIVSAFENAVALEPTRLAQADADYASAKTETDRLRRLIESGRGDASDVSTYQAGMQDLGVAVAARTSALVDFGADAVAGLQPAQGTALVTLLANHEWEVPIHFKVANRTQEDWVKLRKALANERICAKYGDDPDPALMAFLALSRADPSVALAKTSLDTHGATVQAAWKNAASPKK